VARHDRGREPQRVANLTYVSGVAIDTRRRRSGPLLVATCIEPGRYARHGWLLCARRPVFTPAAHGPGPMRRLKHGPRGRRRRPSKHPLVRLAEKVFGDPVPTVAGGVGDGLVLVVVSVLQLRDALSVRMAGVPSPFAVARPGRASCRPSFTPPIISAAHTTRPALRPRRTKP
jgi:hypothetical protein